MNKILTTIKESMEMKILKMNKVELLEVSEEVYTYYKEKLRGNTEDSLLDCKKKLSRNFLLGTPIMDTISGTTKMYGNLKITVKDGEVRCIKNYRGGTMNKIDKEEKERLNKIYRIK